MSPIRAAVPYSPVIGIISALVAVIFAWINAYAIPITAQNAAAVGDYANIYTYAIVSTAIIVLLNILALALGIFAARRRAGLLLAGGAIALSATGLIHVALTLILFFVYPPILV